MFFIIRSDHKPLIEIFDQENCLHGSQNII